MLSRRNRKTLMTIGAVYAAAVLGFITWVQLLDQLSHYRLAILVVLLPAIGIGAVLWVHWRNPELFTREKTGLPHPPDLLQSGPTFRVDTVRDLTDLSAVSRIASEAFGKDAMPYALIRDLHGHSRETVFLLRDRRAEILGYLALMFPTAQLRTAIEQGTIDPLHFQPSDFLIGDERWQGDSIYLESVAIRPGFRRIGLLVLAQSATQWLVENWRRQRRPDQSFQVLALEGSEAGGNLCRRSMDMDKVADAPGREDEMSLYSATRALWFFEALERRISQMLVEQAFGDR